MGYAHGIGVQLARSDRELDCLGEYAIRTYVRGIVSGLACGIMSCNLGRMEVDRSLVDDAQGRAGRSVLKLRIWLSQYPLALAPMWAALAGTLASGRLQWQREHGLQLLGVMILTDGLWGQLWTLLAGQPWSAAAEAANSARSTAPMPYSARESPLSSFWNWLTATSSHTSRLAPVAVWRATVLALLLSAALAWLLGPVALALTALAVLVAMLARFLSTVGALRALFQSVFEIGLPWLLALRLFGEGDWLIWPLAAAAGFVVVRTGSQLLPSREGRWLVALGQVGTLAWLVAADQPLMAGAFGITLLAPFAGQLWLPTGEDGQDYQGRYQRLSGPWWLSAMLIAGWAAGH